MKQTLPYPKVYTAVISKKFVRYRFVLVVQGVQEELPFLRKTRKIKSNIQLLSTQHIINPRSLPKLCDPSSCPISSPTVPFISLFLLTVFFHLLLPSYPSLSPLSFVPSPLPTLIRSLSPPHSYSFPLPSPLLFVPFPPLIRSLSPLIRSLPPLPSLSPLTCAI